MSFAAAAIRLAETAPLPDPLTRAGVALLVERTRRHLLGRPDEEEAKLLAEMDGFPIAVHADAANAQHYELPAEFFRLILGPNLKYSCCLYPEASTTLAQAERLALEATVARAGLSDGQSILELGCGWGSLSLYMAERFPVPRSSRYRIRNRSAPTSSARPGAEASGTLRS